MLKLDKYDQQIILACKGNSKMTDISKNRLPLLEIVRNIIARRIGIKVKYINDHKVYYWLLKLVKKLDDTFNLNWREQLLDSMFCSDWVFSRISCKNTISIMEVNNKLISMIGFIPIRKENEILIELIEDDEILNKMYEY